MGIKFNTKPAVRGLKRAGKEYQRAFRQALLEEGEAIMLESQNQVPRDTGFLANSRFVRVEDGGGEITLELGYTAPYAIYVHEDPTARHRAPTKWKFLEDPIKDASNGLSQRLARRIRSLLRR